MGFCCSCNLDGNVVLYILFSITIALGTTSIFILRYVDIFEDDEFQSYVMQVLIFYVILLSFVLVGISRSNWKAALLREYNRKGLCSIKYGLRNFCFFTLFMFCYSEIGIMIPVYIFLEFVL